MNFKKILFIACSSVFITASSFAQGPPGDGAQGPGGGGGGAAMPETKSFIVDDFVAGVDTDKDGYMTKAEFKAAGLTERMFLTPPFCDPDHDEKITKKEMGECKLPEAVDMNKDGAITKEEMVAFEGTSLGKERGPGEPKPE